MNAEHGFWRRRGEEVELPADQRDPAGRRRLVLVALGLIAVLLLLGWWVLWRGGSPADPGPTLPAVTYVVPGKQSVTSMVSATGTVGARREMPVGVAGEGGMVTSVAVEPGDWVRPGQVLATIDRSVQVEQLGQTQAQIRSAEADARVAQTELDRALALRGRGFISQADVDRKTATRDAAAARVRLARAQSGEVVARLGRLDIRAPAGGLVLTRAVEPGQIVSSGSGALFRLAREGEMELLARLSEQDLGRVRVGMPARVTPVGTTQAFEGRIWQLPPVIDPQTRQGVVRIALAYNPALRPGGFASADVSSGTAIAPLLPESAVLSDARGNFVYVIDSGNVIRRRDVRVGDVSDAGIAILGGLGGGERVVYSAGAFLNPGDKVIPTRAARRG